MRWEKNRKAVFSPHEIVVLSFPSALIIPAPLEQAGRAITRNTKVLTGAFWVQCVFDRQRHALSVLVSVLSACYHHKNKQPPSQYVSYVAAVSNSHFLVFCCCCCVCVCLSLSSLSLSPLFSLFFFFGCQLPLKRRQLKHIPVQHSLYN